MVLVRADGVELLGEVPGSGYRNPPALARRGDGQVVTLTPLLQHTMVAVDGRRDLAEVAEEVGRAAGRLVRPADIAQLVTRSLRPMGLLQLADGSQPEVRRANPLLALRLRKVVTDPAVTRRITAPFAVLFSPFVVLPVVAGFLAVSGWVFFSEGLAAATAQAFRVPGLFLLLVAVTVLSAGFHEFGHAAAARYGGATPGAMGMGIYLVWPAFYTDVTDSYRLGRAGRVRTDLGGLYFNALVVLASFAVWWLTGWHAVLLLVATQVLQMVRQLAPLLRFDGYHVLADVTGVPDLYQRIGAVLRSLLPGRWHQPEATALRPWARAVVSVWVLVVVPLMAFSMLMTVLALPRLLGTAWAALDRAAAQLGADVGDGDVLGVLTQVLVLAVTALPVLGIGFVLLTTVRRVVRKVWRATADRPGRRALAGLVALALVVGLGWAWWPSADRYRPVRAYEGGTVLDAVAAVRDAPAAVRAGAQGSTQTIWPADAGELPTADRPAMALVLVPAAGDAAGTGGAPSDVEAPTWVFPFDRPLPPGAGDNQALAVNTEDGSVRYDVAFALVWADGDTVLDRNEAYALASCSDCRTVAVAFQVVLVVGQADVVVPQNAAVAVNYACVRCVTQALATQLVVTLPASLSPDAEQQLAAVWAELAAFGEQIEGVPLSELQSRLDGFEARILAVVQAEGGTPAAGTTSAVPSTTTPSTTTSSTPHLRPTSSTSPTTAAPTSSSAAGTSGSAPTRTGSSTTPARSTGAGGSTGTTSSGSTSAGSSGTTSTGTTTGAPSSSAPVPSGGSAPTTG